MSIQSAVKLVNTHGILLVFPVANKKEPLSLWSCLYPRTKMRWEWSDEGDNRVALLWHMREALSRSRKVVYGKWLQSRATLFSFPVFTALVSLVSNKTIEDLKLGDDAIKIYRTLLEDSPLATKELRAICGYEGKLEIRNFEKGMKELWSKLLIVGFGEVEEGGFPSLAVGATQLIFEDLWEESKALSPEARSRTLQGIFQAGSVVRKKIDGFEHPSV